jgi:hypothetical protein
LTLKRNEPFRPTLFQVRLLKEQEEEIRRARQSSILAAGHTLSHAEIARLEKSQVERRLDISKAHRFQSRNSDILQTNGQLLTVQGTIWPVEKSTGIDVKPPHFPGCTCDVCNAVVKRVFEESQDKAAHARTMDREFARLMQLKRERTAKMGKDTGKQKAR